MRGAIRAFLASSLAMLAALGTPVTVTDPLHGYEFKPTSRYRNRFPGRHKPAGSKLARKALKGRVGVSTIR